MSLFGTLEIMLDLHQFQNIDLFEQGLYQIRISFETSGNELIQPYIIAETEKQRIMNFGILNSNREAYIDDTYFYSKVFFISFCEQLVDLDDVCVFRVQYNAFPSRSSTLTMKAVLLYSSLQSQDQNSLHQGQLKEVSAYTCKIYNSNDGLMEYIPIMFDDNHFSICKAFIHTIQIEYKYRASPQSSDTIDDFEEFLERLTSNFQKIPLQNFMNNYVDSLREQQLKMQKRLLNIQNDLPGETKNDLLQKLVAIPVIQPNRLSQIYLSDTNRKEISNDILQLINKVGQSLYSIWHLLIEIYKVYKSLYNKQALSDYHRITQQRLHRYIQREGVKITNDFAQYLDNNKLSTREEESRQLRENSKVDIDQNVKVQDHQLFGNSQKLPIFYEVQLGKPKIQEQDLVKKQQTLQQSKEQLSEKMQPTNGRHLIIFVHGYQGNSFDFRLWKNYMFAKYPQFIYLQSSINETNTDLDIRDMGLNLAKEIKNFISERIINTENLRISIIGHSLGGIIARVALMHLDQYQKCFHTFVSLASPHLGLGAQQSKLVETGLWFMKKMNKTCMSLNQLTMSDSSKLSQTLIWQLSQNQKLSLFKNVIVVASHQDMYVPYQSALLMKIKKGILDGDKCEAHNQLIQNMMCNYSNDDLIKIDVSFALKKTTLDSMIGRSAHIEFLDNPVFIRMFIDIYHQYFQ